MAEWTHWHEKHKDKIELVAGVDCWIWVAAIHTSGYGRVSYRRQGEMAHRAAFMEAHNLAEAGLIRHLAEGTYAENGKDMALMFTTRGTLKEAEVIELRRMYADGVPLKQIAKRFGIAHGTVYPIVIGKSYRYVQPENLPKPAARSPRKLSVEEVREIRRRCASGEKQAAIAKDYGIQQGYVSRVNSGLRRTDA